MINTEYLIPDDVLKYDQYFEEFRTGSVAKAPKQLLDLALLSKETNTKSDINMMNILKGNQSKNNRGHRTVSE